MRGLAYALTVISVIGLAFWAYHENYNTQKVITDSEHLQRDIGAARSRLSILRAEWAYLNRPNRLRDLAEINFDRLGLLPLRPDQFGKIDQVTFPPAIGFGFDDVTEVSSTGADMEDGGI